MTPAKATLVCIGRFHLFDLARELQKRNMLETIFTGYPRWKLKDEDLPPGFIQTFPWLQTPYMALLKWKLLGEGKFQKELFWQIQESLDRHVAKNLPDSDVLFALSGSGLRCGQLMQRRGHKYICDRGSSHIRYQNAILNDEFKRWGESFPGIDNRIMDKEEAEYDAADLVTVPSTFAHRTFTKMGVPRQKLCVAPYGVDIRRFEKISDPESGHFNVLFIGYASLRKGVPYLFQAFNKFRHPKKRLVFAGGISPEINRFFNRTPPPANVKFLGHIPQHKLKNVISRSHVMVLPSIEEGLALVQAQALACGCPVIGTSHSGAEDLFFDGKEGFIVPIRDSKSIAEKLQLLADDPDLRVEMSIAATNRTAEMGGTTQYGEHISTAINQLVGT